MSLLEALCSWIILLSIILKKLRMLYQGRDWSTVYTTLKSEIQCKWECIWSYQKYIQVSRCPPIDQTFLNIKLWWKKFYGVWNSKLFMFDWVRLDYRNQTHHLGVPYYFAHNFNGQSVEPSWDRSHQLASYVRKPRSDVHRFRVDRIDLPQIQYRGVACERQRVRMEHGRGKAGRTGEHGRRLVGVFVTSLWVS